MGAVPLSQNKTKLARSVFTACGNSFNGILARHITKEHLMSSFINKFLNFSPDTIIQQDIIP
jgi:hypothetical protein